MADGHRKSRKAIPAFESQSFEEDARVFNLLRAVSLDIRGPRTHRIITWHQPDAAVRMLDCRLQNLPLIDEALTEKLAQVDRRHRRRAIDELTEDGAQYTLEFSLTLTDGHEIWLRETGQRIAGSKTEATHIISTLTEVTDQKIWKNNVARALKSEPISGLLSQSYFDDVLGHIGRCAGQPQIIRINIDNLNDVFSVYGPKATDYLIEVISNRIKGEVSPNDLVSFDGGAEFKIFFPNLTAQALLERSKKIRFILDRLPIESPFGTLNPDCSMVIESAMTTEPDINLPTMPQIQRAANQPLGPITEIDILLALDQNRFELALQPICKSGQRQIEYFEALLRIRDEDGILHSAFPYIRAAEDLNVISSLDLRALSLAKKIMRVQKDIRLSVNISVGTLIDEKAFGAYLAEIESLGLHAKRLMVELTETMALENLDIANLFANKLQSYGVKLAIDDFGAGHTSFKNLLGLEAQVIKIDGRYIRNIATNAEKQNFVRLLAEMADVFGLTSVAEMIDNEADARMVERLGVHYLQGFYLGRPKSDGPVPTDFRSKNYLSQF